MPVNTEYYEITEQSENLAFKACSFVRRRREQLGITQLYLAESTGLSREYISRLERGKKLGLRLDTFAKLCLALNTRLVISPS